MQSRSSRSSSRYRDLQGTTFKPVPWIPPWSWSYLGEIVMGALDGIIGPEYEVSIQDNDRISQRIYYIAHRQRR